MNELDDFLCERQSDEQQSDTLYWDDFLFEDYDYIEFQEIMIDFE